VISFLRCKIVDKHLALLAPKHMETKFCKINAEKCPFLTDRLKIRYVKDRQFPLLNSSVHTLLWFVKKVFNWHLGLSLKKMLFCDLGWFPHWHSSRIPKLWTTLSDLQVNFTSKLFYIFIFIIIFISTWYHNITSLRFRCTNP